MRGVHEKQQRGGMETDPEMGEGSLQAVMLGHREEQS